MFLWWSQVDVWTYIVVALEFMILERRTAPVQIPSIPFMDNCYMAMPIKWANLYGYQENIDCGNVQL